MYDLLVAASERNPIVDNEQGSLVTMSSLQALIFGIINIVGNFGTVFVDNVRFYRTQKRRLALTLHLLTGLLAKSYRCSSSICCQGLSHWWFILVRYSIYIGHYHGFSRQSA